MFEYGISSLHPIMVLSTWSWVPPITTYRFRPPIWQQKILQADEFGSARTHLVPFWSHSPLSWLDHVKSLVFNCHIQIVSKVKPPISTGQIMSNPYLFVLAEPTDFLDAIVLLLILERTNAIELDKRNIYRNTSVYGETISGKTRLTRFFSFKPFNSCNEMLILVDLMFILPHCPKIS